VTDTGIRSWNDTLLTDLARITDRAQSPIFRFSIDEKQRQSIANGTNNPNPCSGSDAQVVDQAALNALSRLNPKQNENNNVLPYTSNFAKVVNPGAINTRNWASQFSAHGRAVESPGIPGRPGYDVKMYSDPSLGNTIAVIYPTTSFLHFYYFLPFELGYPVNANIARQYLGCPVKK
jgi:hypothetical protein